MQYAQQNQEMQASMGAGQNRYGGQPAQQPGGRANPEFVRQENAPANRVNQRSRNQYRNPEDINS